MSEKLKPCPFCGGRAELKHYIIKGYEPDRMYYVECSKCEQTVVKGKFDTTYHSHKWAINKAIKAWNKRPNPWHTGIPTDEGDYLVKDTTGHYKTLVFVRGQWLIACFDDWHEFPTSDVLKWQKIEDKETE